MVYVCAYTLQALSAGQGCRSIDESFVLSPISIPIGLSLGFRPLHIGHPSPPICCFSARCESFRAQRVGFGRANHSSRQS